MSGQKAVFGRSRPVPPTRRCWQTLTHQCLVSTRLLAFAQQLAQLHHARLLRLPGGSHGLAEAEFQTVPDG